MSSDFPATTGSSGLGWVGDRITGFVPVQPPLSKLPSAWGEWEAVLGSAVELRLQLVERVERLDPQRRVQEELKSSTWRENISKMRLLSIEQLKTSNRQLQRAHHVLCFLLHFYAHTIPSNKPILIPRSLGVPLLQVSRELATAPIITHSDLSLHNWRLRDPSLHGGLPTPNNLQMLTTFTGTSDEQEFHLLSTKIELRSGEALELLRLAVEAAFVEDTTSQTRAVEYLNRAALVIRDLRETMLGARGRIDPDIFYNEIRVWLTGADGDPWSRPWVIEGSDQVGQWPERCEITGATAGQSPSIRALDLYLGVDVNGGQTSNVGQKAFHDRMFSYMTFQHRSFLKYLRDRPHQLRVLVQQISKAHGCDFPLIQAYNRAVKALKEFRDAHMIMVTLLIIGPARRDAKPGAEAEISATPPVVAGGSSNLESEKDESLMERAFADGGSGKGDLKGTGGTDLARFLKGVRDQTPHAYLQDY